jgi:hypothetical protein
MITDNGIGRYRAQEIKERQQEHHHSFATQAAEKRMALLNQYHHKRYSIEIEDLQGAQAEVLGTRVKVIIPM